jgi:hypothetical protein
LVEKVLKAKKEDGLIATLLMEKEGINLVAALAEKRDQNILHAAPPRAHAKNAAAANLGVKNQREVKNNEKGKNQNNRRSWLLWGAGS